MIAPEFSIPDIVQRLLAHRKAFALAQASGQPQVLPDGNAVTSDGTVVPPGHPQHPQNLGGLVSAQAQLGGYGQAKAANPALSPQALRGTLPPGSVGGGGPAPGPTGPPTFMPQPRGRGAY